MLNCSLKNEQIYNALEAADLQVSGNKEERIQRLIYGLVPASEILNYFHIDELRDFCRQNCLLCKGR